MLVKFIGVIKHIEPRLTFKSGFSLVRFIITEADPEEKYPEDLPIEFGGRTFPDIEEQYAVGQKVEVEFFPSAHEHQGGIYISLKAWKITPRSSVVAGDSEAEQQPQGEQSEAAQPDNYGEASAATSGSGEDALPF